MTNQSELNLIIEKLQEIEQTFKIDDSKNVGIIYFIISGYIISCIDGKVDDEEIECIKEYLADLTNKQLPNDFINIIINKTKSIIDKNISKFDIYTNCQELLNLTTICFINYLREKKLTNKRIQEEKEKYLYNLYRIAYSDGLFHPNEQEAIKHIAYYYLNFNENERGEIRNKARISSAYQDNFDSIRKKYLELRYQNISKPRIYFAGPFKNFDIDLLNNKFNDCKNKYYKDFHFFTPTERSKFYREMTREQEFQAIAKDQKEDIFNSDALIAYMPRPSIGTAIAINYAHLTDKLVVVVVDNIDDLPSNMLPAYSSKIVSNFEEAILYCKNEIDKIINLELKIANEYGKIQVYKFENIRMYLTNVIYKSGIKDIFDISITVLSRTILRKILKQIECGEISNELINFSTIEDIIESFLIKIADSKPLENLAKSFINFSVKLKENILLDNSMNTVYKEADSFIHDLKSPIGSATRNINHAFDIMYKANLFERLNPADKEYVLSNIDLAKENLDCASLRIKNYLNNIKSNYVKTKINIVEKIYEIFNIIDKINKDIILTITKDNIVFLNIIESKFERIFENLFKNSIEHGFKNKDQGTINIEIKSNEIEKALIINFWNDGEELSKEKCQMIFNPVNNISSESGVGLAGVKHNVEELGGSIECEYQENLGPIFKLIFYNTHISVGTKILIADNDKNFRNEMKLFLKRKEFDFVETINVDETIKYLNNENFAAILCDIDFDESDGKSGIDVVDHIRTNNIPIKIIVITGSSAIQNWKERIKQYNPDKILYKEDPELQNEIEKSLKW